MNVCPVLFVPFWFLPLLGSDVLVFSMFPRYFFYDIFSIVFRLFLFLPRPVEVVE